MAEQGFQGAMAEQTVRGDMAVQGSQEAMAEQGASLYGTIQIKDEITQLDQGGKKKRKKKSHVGRSQRIVSSSSPNWKQAPRADLCQLTQLESSRNFSNVQPLCRRAHSLSSASDIFIGPVFCHDFKGSTEM